jgi:beta-glucanase (GH16 family)
MVLKEKKKMKMKALLLFLMALLMLLMVPAGAQAQTGWTLVWSDEFNGPAGSFPSSSIWNFNQGNPGVNGELETYCAPGNNTSPCSAANPNIFEDGNGNLVIRAIHTASGTWTSGRMNTAHNEMPQYGRIEARMKLVVGDGLWPAFWMLGSDSLTGTGWPQCGEQDILEWVPQYGPTTTSSHIHGPGYSGGAAIGGDFTFPNGGRIDDANYHTYGVVWSQNSIAFYRDNPDTPFKTITPADIPAGDAWVYNQPFYILLNQAVGGNFPKPGPDGTTPSPADVLVDYVRVYTPGPTCSAPTAPTALAAAAISSSQINLDWTASTSSCSVTYNVFRSTTSGFAPSGSNQIATGVTGTTYSDTSLLASTTYYYLVEGTNSAGTSGASNQGSATTQSNSTGSQLIAINAGGPAASPFVADEDFAGGATIDHANTINTSKVTNPAPAVVYQSGRDETFTYTIGGFTAGTDYLVRLHFCETFFAAAGKRTFNVSINGTQVLTAFDIFKTAGGENIANIQQFTEPANASGQFVITFTSVVNNSLVSGIEVDSTTGPPPPTGVEINSGGPAVSPFVADEDFTGGATIDHANTINTSKVTNPAPAAVYQSARVAATAGAGTTFSYTIGGFTANSSHTVRLHFCETFWTAAGDRVFNVSINGTQVLTNFDIFATAGGQNIANIQQFTEAANASGQYVLTFTSDTDKALISGIEID